MFLWNPVFHYKLVWITCKVHWLQNNYQKQMYMASNVCITHFESLSIPSWFIEGISGSYWSGFTSLSGRESVSTPTWSSASECLLQQTMVSRHRHFLFRCWRILTFFDTMYRMYTTSAVCGIPIISNPVTPIAWLYLWFGKYLTNKHITACVLSKARSRLSIILKWSTLYGLMRVLCWQRPSLLLANHTCDQKCNRFLSRQTAHQFWR